MTLKGTSIRLSAACAIALAGALGASPVCADAVTDWNIRSGQLVSSAGLSTPAANRVMALVQTAAFDAANAISRRYASAAPTIEAAAGASIDAAIAAAHRAALTPLLPASRAAIDEAYRTALSALPDDTATRNGVAVGDRAAAAVLAARANDGAEATAEYRPSTTAGAYVPTVMPLVTQWPQRRPWLMSRPDQFRPGPPPALRSADWARDYGEIRAIGGARSRTRTAEQTAVARFWETSLPPIFHGLVRGVALMPGRDVTQNARLFAMVAQATDDAVIAVFDAKYHYGFWRPVTAIRNGDLDGNDATAREAAWLPLIETPLHPEYPCAHCIVAATVGTILRADVGDGPQPVWTTTSVSAVGAARRWATVDDFIQEVSDARVHGGLHFRTSTQVAIAMGRQIGALAVARAPRN